jgi:endogenous inhibitor of DNA gyrase (YacG/DUF329 family)
MTLTAHCPTCKFSGDWDVDARAALRVHQPGGARQPDVPRSLAIWRLWRRAIADPDQRVIAACPACGLPLTSSDPDAPWDSAWTFTAPFGTVRIGAEGTFLDDAPADPDTLDAQLERLWGPRIRVSDVIAVHNVFGLVFITIVGTVATLWVFAVLFLVRFITAMGSQDNITIPLPP